LQLIKQKDINLTALVVGAFVNDTAKMQKKTDDKYAEFNKLLQESQMILVKVCMQFTDRQPDSIKDLYQEIAINLWESMPSFRGDSSQTTWVYRIAINTAYMELRKRARQNLFVDLDQQMLESLAEEAQDERTQILYDIIDRLPKNERTIFYLYLDDLSISQIADILGRTEAAVRQKIYRIKNKIRKEYERLERI
jgi:RNA polymerase sigma-70 factor (ECF subfamily)